MSITKVTRIINKDIILEGVYDFQLQGINPFITQCLTKCEFKRPTPIQYHSIRTFIDFPNSNIIAQSKSGTGKTLAFLVPIINQISQNKNFNKETVCLIILPTRQLAIQVHQYLKQIINSANQIKPKLNQKEFKFALKTLSSLLTIGGIPIQDDKKTLLTSGANFVIGTVGKIYQLIESGFLKISTLKYVIFDQGDKLFAGKDQKLMKILQRINSTVIKDTVKENIFRFLVFSATYDQNSVKKIVDILSKTLRKNENHEPKFHFIQTLTHSNTNQYIQKVTQNWRELNFVKFQHRNQKSEKKQEIQEKGKQINQTADIINLENIKKYWIQIENSKSSLLVRKCNTLKKVFKELEFKKCLIFVQKKALLQQINNQLKQFQPLVIHGSLTQASRIKAMNQAHKSKIIISSDLLARGIDLVLDLVILYDAQINETLWHRIGRTGRFGRIGVALSLQKIQDWKAYEAHQINEILRQSGVVESKLKRNEWYGSYMTEYGQWQQMSIQKQEIINRNYNFYNQQQQNLQGIERMVLSKKLRKELKRVEKQVMKEGKKKQDGIFQILGHDHQCADNNEIKDNILSMQIKVVNREQQVFTNQQLTTFKSEQQFKSYFKNLFSCKGCLSLIKQTSHLTSYQFQIEKYFQIQE